MKSKTLLLLGVLALLMTTLLTFAAETPPDNPPVVGASDKVTINMEDLGYVVSFILILGGILKRVPKINNDWIPTITWALGALLYLGLSKGWGDLRQWLAAAVAVASATGLHSATLSTVDAVKGAGKAAGVFLIGGLLSFGLLGGLTGCVTAPDGSSQPDVARIAAVAREAATVGTQEALLARPDWADEFTLAYNELLALEQRQTISANDLLDILNRLPVKELKGREARIAISLARITISGANWSVIDAERLEQIKPVITAIREGMAAGGAVP